MSEQNSRRNRRYFIGLFSAGCLTLVILVVTPLIAGAWWLFSGGSDDRTEAFRAKGYPTTIEELEAWYPEPPEGENAAELYMTAGHRLYVSRSPARDEVPLLGDAEWPPLGTPISDTTRESISAFINHESEAFDLIDQAVAFEHSRYPVQFVWDEESTYISYMELMRDAQYGQQLRVLDAVGRSKPDDVLKEFATLVHVARSLRSEPTMIASSIGNSSAFDVVYVAEYVLDEVVLSSTQLKQLDESLALLLENDSLLRGSVGGWCEARNRSKWDEWFAKAIGMPLANDETMADRVEFAEDGLPKRIDDYGELSDRAYSTENDFSGFSRWEYVYHVGEYYGSRANVSAARAAIAIQRWRGEGNVLPDDFEGFPESILSNWPIDPFSGDPLRYKKEQEGFIVYSIGGGLKVDGGALGDALDTTDIGTNPHDVVFRILK